MERYWVRECDLRIKKYQVGACYVDTEPIEMVKLADAQATVEALQAQLKTARYDAVRAFVRGEDKMCFVCGAKEPCELKDDPSSPCTFDPTPMELKQQVAALQRVRDEFEHERDQLHAALMEAKAALDAEREKVKGLEDEGVKLFEWRLALHSLTPGGSEFCTPDACEQWVRKSRTSQHEYIIEQIKQRKDLQAQLAQLRALVRAKEDAYEKILLSRERLEREMRGYPPVDNEGIPMVWQEPVGWVKRHPGRHDASNY